MMNVTTIPSPHNISGHVEIVKDAKGMVSINVENDVATASIALQGAHVTRYQPVGHEPVLWVSKQVVFASRKAIRGGIPICWPWFGNHPTDNTKAAHGFVRTRDWSIYRTAHQGSETIVELACGDDEDTRALWPHPFQLLLRVTVGQQLQVELVVTNSGDTPFQYTGALHSYFSIGDIENVSISGLDGASYIDTLDENKIKVQAGGICFDAETDRIYIDTTSECIINDPVKGRSIAVSKSGSHSTVIWNPWQDKSAGMADFGNDEYPQMVCIETTNAAGDIIEVDVGQSVSIATSIKLQ